MLWCHNCKITISEQQKIENCPQCCSEALEEISASDCPCQFRPYFIIPSLLSLLPPPPPPRIDTSEPVSVTVRTTLLQSTDDPARFRVMREYFVRHVQKKNGISLETLQSLKRTEDVGECCICFSENIEKGIILGCNHIFHEKCLTPWVEENNTCPCCRHLIE